MMKNDSDVLVESLLCSSITPYPHTSRGIASWFRSARIAHRQFSEGRSHLHFLHLLYTIIFYSIGNHMSTGLKGIFKEIYMTIVLKSVLRKIFSPYILTFIAFIIIFLTDQYKTLKGFVEQDIFLKIFGINIHSIITAIIIVIVVFLISVLVSKLVNKVL